MTRNSSNTLRLIRRSLTKNWGKKRRMNKRDFGFVFLVAVPMLSTIALGADLNQVNYNGMQLAFVILPATPATGETTESPKSKSKPKSGQTSTSKPTQEPAPKAIQPPATKPALQAPAAGKPALETRPAPVPKPVQLPVARPAQVVVIKPDHQAAAGETPAFEWVIGLGVDFGGEELGKLYFTDGSSAAVKANNGLAFNVGAILANGKNSAFSTQVTLGYKYGGQRGTDGSVTWTAIPLELIEYYQLSSLRMGLGLSYQIRPQLNVNLPASNYTDKYNNAIGLIAQIGWAPAGKHYSVDLRYTSIKFQLSDVPDAPMVSGNVAGLYTSYRF